MRGAPEDRFRAMTLVNVESGCHIWTGVIRDGYGLFKIEGRVQSAHRVAYAWRHGPVPQGLVLDHLCCVRACVNPDHLEAVTQRENLIRGGVIQKTHCVWGHEYNAENTYTNPNSGERFCRVCHRASCQRANARRRAARLERAA